jgi:hypothetical protein
MPRFSPLTSGSWRPSKCQDGRERDGSLKLAVRAFCLFRSRTAGFQRILSACPVLVFVWLVLSQMGVKLPLFMGASVLGSEI